MVNVLLLAVALTGTDIPLYQLRFSAGQTAPDVWPRTLEAFDRHPGTFDEVWFSTGVTYPDLAWHRAKAAEQAKAAADLRTRGIAPSLQVQVTLGHGFGTTNAADWAAKTWTGFTGVSGEECPNGSCPRDPRFLDYISESTSYYAAYRPPWVWIDDDLRVLGHGPASKWLYSGDRRTFGCWCGRCVGDFAKAEGRAWTRETLAKAIGDGDAALGDRWERFSFGSLAGVARRIAERFHALSPETRFGYQHCAHFNDSQRQVFRALHEATGGQPVGDRPGGSWYQDHDPYGQLLKAYRVARESADLGDMPEILVTTPEIETYPRVFTSRTANGILIEALTSLTMGMNALSLYFMDPRTGETVDFYERRFFGPLAANAALFREFRRHTAGTLPTGLRSDRTYPVFHPLTMQAGTPEPMQLVTGVPIVYGKSRALGTIDMDEVNAWAVSSAKLLALYAKADALAGGRLPVVPTEPIQGWLMPRTAADGTLRSVTYLNTTLDESWPTRLRLRGVARGTRTAKWWALGGATRDCEVTYEGADAFVTLPPVAHWSGGWLQL